MGIANFLDHISGSFTQDFAAAGVSGHLPGSMTCAENAQRTSTTPRKHGNLSAAAAGGGVGIILLLYAPAINKEFLIWLVGLLHLVFVFRRTRQAAAAAQQLKERLREKGAVPGLYTFSKFTQPCAVYVKLKFPKLNSTGYAETQRSVRMCHSATSATSVPPTSRSQRESTTESPIFDNFNNSSFQRQKLLFGIGTTHRLTTNSALCYFRNTRSTLMPGQKNTVLYSDGNPS